MSIQINDLVTCAGEGDTLFCVTGIRVGTEEEDSSAWLVREQATPVSHGWEPIRKLTKVSLQTSSDEWLIRNLHGADSLRQAREIFKEWKTAKLDKWRCRDCKTVYPEDYMVYDNVWRAAGLEPKVGRVCLSCLEKRLGSPLMIEDFLRVPANSAIRYGYEMGLRDKAEEIADLKKEE